MMLKGGRLKHATKAQQDAAFAKVWPELVAVAREMASQVNIPFINIQALIERNISSPQVRSRVVMMIDDALDAAENVPHEEGEHGPSLPVPLPSPSSESA